MPLEQAWQDWIAFEHEFQRSNLAEVREHPITPYRTLAARPVGIDLADVLRRGDRHALRRASAILASSSTSARSTPATAALRRLADIKRAMLYSVTSFAFDPESGTAFYTNDNLALRDLMAVDVRTGESRMLLEDARIGEIAFNPADRSLLRRRATPRAGGARAHSATRTREWYAFHVFPYGVGALRPRHLARRQAAVGVGERGQRRPVPARVGARQVLAGDDEPDVASSASGSRCPRASSSRRTGATCTAAATTPACRTSSATRSRRVMSRRCRTPSRTSSARCRSADGRLLVLVYTADGLRSGDHRSRRRSKDVSAIRFLGAELAKKHPVVKKWQVRSAGRRRLTKS